MIFLSFKESLGDIGSKIFPSFEAFIVQLLATAVLFFVVIKFLYKPAKEFIAKRQKYIKNQPAPYMKNNGFEKWVAKFYMLHFLTHHSFSNMRTATCLLSLWILEFDTDQ